MGITTLLNIESILKTLYLDEITNRLNTSDLLYSKIPKKTNKVWGAKIQDNFGNFICKLSNIYGYFKLPKIITAMTEPEKIVETIDKSIFEALIETQNHISKMVIGGDDNNYNGIKLLIDEEHKFNFYNEDVLVVLDNNPNDFDLVVCDTLTRRKITNYLTQQGEAVESIQIENGVVARAYNGIPIVANRFCEPNEILCLNTSQFQEQRLCDWRFLEDDNGRILREDADGNYIVTIVKYANLISIKQSSILINLLKPEE